MISATEGVLVQFVESFFAEFLAEALVSQIREVARSAIEDSAADPILVRVSPQDAPALRDLLSDDDPVPFQVEEEPSLATGQVYCVLGAKERKIDLADLVDTTRNALAALHDLNERILKHG